jgi:hypothetical protein
MDTRILVGAYRNDVEAIMQNEPLNAITVDDTKVGSLNIWSSAKVSEYIRPVSQLYTGTALISPCVLNSWMALTLTGSPLSDDKLAVKVSTPGVYHVKLICFESGQATSGSCTIQLRSEKVLPFSTSSLIEVNKPQQPFHDRLLTLQAGDEIQFKLIKSSLCASITKIVWIVQSY